MLLVARTDVIVIYYIAERKLVRFPLRETSLLAHTRSLIASCFTQCRLQQTGKNASGQTHYLSLSGFEIYGTVTGVCDDLGKAAKEAEANLRKQRRQIRQQLKHMVVGARVTRGPDWKW